MPEERRVRLTVNFPHENLLRRGEGFSRRRWGVTLISHNACAARGFHHVPPHSIGHRISPFELPVERRKGGRMVLRRTTSDFVFSCKPRADCRADCRGVGLAKSLLASEMDPGFSGLSGILSFRCDRFMEFERNERVHAISISDQDKR